MLTNKEVKLIFISQLNGQIQKFIDTFWDLLNDTQEPMLVILMGKVFNPEKDFSQLKGLEKLERVRFLILDESEVGIVIKHKILYSHYDLAGNITLLGRSGVYTFNGLRIMYLNGEERLKYLFRNRKYHYTSSCFSREDLDKLIDENLIEGLQTDILLLNTLPSIIFNDLNSSSLNNNSIGSCSSQICDRVSFTADLLMKKINPRYLITSAGDFYLEKRFINSESRLIDVFNLAFFPSDLEKDKILQNSLQIGLVPKQTNDDQELIHLAESKLPYIILDKIDNDITKILHKLKNKIKSGKIEIECKYCFNSSNLDKDLLLKETEYFYLSYSPDPIKNYHFVIRPKKHLKYFVDLEDIKKLEFTKIIKTVIKIIYDAHLEYIVYEKNLPSKEESMNHMTTNIIGIEKKFTISYLEVMRRVLNDHNVSFKEFDAKHSITEMVDKNSHYYYMDAPVGARFVKTLYRTKLLIKVDQAESPTESKTEDKENNSINLNVDYPRLVICALVGKDSNQDTIEIDKDFVAGLKEKCYYIFN